MKTIKVQQLTLEAFRNYGRFAPILAPITPYIGEDPIRFYRDIIKLDGDNISSISNTVIQPMDWVVDVLEYHTATGEGFMVLDGDAIICVGEATPDGEIPLDSLEAFYLPKGVMVYINPGVWHYAPYPAQPSPISSMVILPERTYANDCVKKEIPPEKQLAIVL